MIVQYRQLHFCRLQKNNNCVLLYSYFQGEHGVDGLVPQTRNGANGSAQILPYTEEIRDKNRGRHGQIQVTNCTKSICSPHITELVGRGSQHPPQETHPPRPFRPLLTICPSLQKVPREPMQSHLHSHLPYRCQFSMNLLKSFMYLQQWKNF